jgi:hypothetical protein
MKGITMFTEQIKGAVRACHWLQAAVLLERGAVLPRPILPRVRVFE